MKVIPKYIPILKAKKGELSAYEHLSQSIKNNTLPIFEMPTENWEKTQKPTSFVSLDCQERSTLRKSVELSSAIILYGLIQRDAL